MHMRPLESTDSVTVDSTSSTWEIFGENCVYAKHVKTWFSCHSFQMLCDHPCERMRREQLFTHLSGASRQTPSHPPPRKRKDFVQGWFSEPVSCIGVCMQGSLHKCGQFKGRYLGDHSQSFGPGLPRTTCGKLPWRITLPSPSPCLYSLGGRPCGHWNFRLFLGALTFGYFLNLIYYSLLFPFQEGKELYNIRARQKHFCNISAELGTIQTVV